MDTYCLLQIAHVRKVETEKRIVRSVVWIMMSVLYPKSEVEHDTIVDRELPGGLSVEPPPVGYYGSSI